MNNVMRVDFEVGICNSDGEMTNGFTEKVCVLFNRTVIAEDEVVELVNSGMYLYDNRIVITTPTRANNLKGK